MTEMEKIIMEKKINYANSIQQLMTFDFIISKKINAINYLISNNFAHFNNYLYYRFYQAKKFFDVKYNEEYNVESPYNINTISFMKSVYTSFADYKFFSSEEDNEINLDDLIYYAKINFTKEKLNFYSELNNIIEYVKTTLYYEIGEETIYYGDNMQDETPRNWVNLGIVKTEVDNRFNDLMALVNTYKNEAVNYYNNELQSQAFQNAKTFLAEKITSDIEDIAGNVGILFDNLNIDLSLVKSDFSDFTNPISPSTITNSFVNPLIVNNDSGLNQFYNSIIITHIKSYCAFNQSSEFYNFLKANFKMFLNKNDGLFFIFYNFNNLLTNFKNNSISLYQDLNNLDESLITTKQYLPDISLLSFIFIPKVIINPDKTSITLKLNTQFVFKEMSSATYYQIKREIIDVSTSTVIDTKTTNYIIGNNAYRKKVLDEITNEIEYWPSLITNYQDEFIYNTSLPIDFDVESLNDILKVVVTITPKHENFLLDNIVAYCNLMEISHIIENTSQIMGGANEIYPITMQYSKELMLNEEFIS